MAAHAFRAGALQRYCNPGSARLVVDGRRETWIRSINQIWDVGGGSGGASVGPLRYPVAEVGGAAGPGLPRRLVFGESPLGLRGRPPRTQGASRLVRPGSCTMPAGHPAVPCTGRFGPRRCRHWSVGSGWRTRVRSPREQTNRRARGTRACASSFTPPFLRRGASSPCAKEGTVRASAPRDQRKKGEHRASSVSVIRVLRLCTQRVKPHELGTVVLDLFCRHQGPRLRGEFSAAADVDARAFPCDEGRYRLPTRRFVRNDG